MIGWALGGLIFGPIADRYGRSKTMAITILIYAGFTGLCATASSWQELAFYRFMTGLGIGGEWSAGAALIAETWPARSRAKAAGIMQASGGIGFFLASLLVFIHRALWLALGLRFGNIAGNRCILYSPNLKRARTLGPRQGDRKPVRSLFVKPVRRDVLVGTGWPVIATFGYQGAIQWVPSWVSDLLHAQGPRTVIPQVSLVTSVSERRRHIGCLCLSSHRRPMGPQARADDLFHGRRRRDTDDLFLRRGFYARRFWFHRSSDFLAPEFLPASRFIFPSFSPQPSGPPPKGFVTTSPVSFPPRLPSSRALWWPPWFFCQGHNHHRAHLSCRSRCAHLCARDQRPGAAGLEERNRSSG